MSGEERRNRLLQYIQESSGPVSGTRLAEKFQVSRQVIVQDIALLRAQNIEILSTTKGYICQKSALQERIFHVYHTDDQIQEELNAIVDCGAIVADVFVEHEIYGHLQAEMMVNSRKKVQEFVEDIHRGKSRPLKNITSGYHYHRVLADNQETLDLVEQELKKRGFLASTAEKI